MRCVRIIFIVVFLFGIISCGQDKKDNKNDIKDELALLDVKIRQEPKNADLYYARSKVLLEKGNMKESLMDIQTAIDLNKKEVKYYVRKADILFKTGETT